MDVPNKGASAARRKNSNKYFSASGGTRRFLNSNWKIELRLVPEMPSTDSFAPNFDVSHFME
jgi:hypothetical protein